MNPRRTVGLAAVGVCLAVVALAVDLVGAAGLSGAAATAWGVAAIVGALIAAGTLYGQWSIADERTVVTHSTTLAALIGGACIAAAVASDRADGRVFGSDALATLGVLALVAAVVCAPIARRG